MGKTTSLLLVLLASFALESNGARAEPPNYFLETFNTPIALSDAPWTERWRADRQAPDTFATATLNGENVLELNIDETGPQHEAFEATQGRKRSLYNGIGTYITADLFIPSDWKTPGTRRYGGLWGQVIDAEGRVVGYPILAFTAEEGFLFFTQDSDQNQSNGYTSNYVELGFPEGFEWGRWYTLRITLLEKSFLAFVNDKLVYRDTVSRGATQWTSIMLQGYNYDGTDYSLYWDNVGAGPLERTGVEESWTLYR